MWEHDEMVSSHEPNITEAATVQFRMVRHAAEIGWTALSPQDALAMRGGNGWYHVPTEEMLDGDADRETRRRV